MSSQTDLDQGGTFRQQGRVYMGPSLGWQIAPATVYLPVTSGGTTTVVPGNTLITVDSPSMSPLIQLPSAKGNTAGAGAVPGTWIPTPITIVDVGGHAGAVGILIVPFAGETIDGLTSITIDSNYGAFVLRPNLVSGGWTLVQ